MVSAFAVFGAIIKSVSGQVSKKMGAEKIRIFRLVASEGCFPEVQFSSLRIAAGQGLPSVRMISAHQCCFSAHFRKTGAADLSRFIVTKDARSSP